MDSDNLIEYTLEQVLYGQKTGELRCDTCTRTAPMKQPDDPWPTCCGSLMGWWNDQDIKNGTRERKNGPPKGPRVDRRWSHLDAKQAIELWTDGYGMRTISDVLGIPRRSLDRILRGETGERPPQNKRTMLNGKAGSVTNRLKWTPEQVNRVLTLSAQGYSQRVISKQLDIPKSSVQHIIRAGR